MVDTPVPAGYRTIAATNDGRALRTGDAVTVAGMTAAVLATCDGDALERVGVA